MRHTHEIHSSSPPHSSCCSHTKPPIGLTGLIVSEALYLADAILCSWNALSPSTSSAKFFLGLFSPAQMFHEANPRVIPSSILLLLLVLTSVLASKGPDSNRGYCWKLVSLPASSPLLADFVAPPVQRWVCFSTLTLLPLYSTYCLQSILLTVSSDFSHEQM